MNNTETAKTILVAAMVAAGIHGQVLEGPLQDIGIAEGEEGYCAFRELEGEDHACVIVDFFEGAMRVGCVFLADGTEVTSVPFSGPALNDALAWLMEQH